LLRPKPSRRQWQLADLADAPVAHARPFGQARQARFAGDATAQFAACLGEADLVAALAQCTRRLEAGGAATDHQHAARRAAGLDVLGVPALAPFLAHGRVLRAADW
jgi:hypothetical protein